MRKYVLPAIALLIVASVVAAWWTRRDNRINVLLIIVDTLRADHLGCYGYRGSETPTIDELASEGTRFSRVVTTSPVTAPSVTTILTSTYPTFHGVRDNEFFSLNPGLPTIASVFREAGYQTAAFVASAVLDRRCGLRSGFDHYDDDMSAEFANYGERYELDRDHEQGTERRAEAVTNAVIGWLKKRRSRDPFFCAVHYFDPHLGYNPPPPFRERFPTRPYDGEIAYTDDQIGVLLDALTGMNLRKNTMVVLTADHGEGLGEHREDSHGFFIYDGTVLVPLIFNMKGNIRAGHVSHSQVRTVDIMPTILDLAGLDVPATAQGVSSASLMQDPEVPAEAAHRDAYIETFHTLYSYRWHELQGIRTAGWKYIRAPQPELYDLQVDPGETVNLIHERAAEAENLEKKLADLEDETARGRGPFPAKRVSSDPEVVEKMKALGYVGTDADTRKKLPEPGGDHPDPKIMIGGLNARYEARRLLRDAIANDGHGDIAAALENLTTAEGLVPNYAEVISFKGYILFKKGEVDEGIRLMEESIEMSPDSKNLSQMFNNLGTAYFRQQEYGKAADRFEKALAASEEDESDSPATIHALRNLGAAYLRLGDCDNAIDRMRRSLEVDYNLRAVLQMCAAYEKCGSPGRAADELEKALNSFTNLDPDFAANTKKKIAQLRAGEKGRRPAESKPQGR